MLVRLSMELTHVQVQLDAGGSGSERELQLAKMLDEGRERKGSIEIQTGLTKAAEMGMQGQKG